jgi:hypothetical protein
MQRHNSRYGKAKKNLVLLDVHLQGNEKSAEEAFEGKARDHRKDKASKGDDALLCKQGSPADSRGMQAEDEEIGFCASGRYYNRQE